MREISNRFCLVSPEALKESLLLNDEPYIPTGTESYPCSSKIIFSQTPNDSDAGTSWAQTFRGVTLHADVYRWNGRKAFIGIIMTDGSVKYIGSYSDQPTVKVTPHERGTYVVEASFSSLKAIQL